MPDITWFFEKLESLPSNILSIICIVLAFMYYCHIKRKNKTISEEKSKYEIAVGMNKELGQITLFPKYVKEVNTSKYKYAYNCSLQLNAVKSFLDGFNMTLTSSEEFKIIFGQNIEAKSVLRKPKHSVHIDSNSFKSTQHSLTRINSFDFTIYTAQKQLDLDININFGSGVINSKLVLNP